MLVGPGSRPLVQQGKVYLTGPYEGAPFGLSIVVPAIAGPYNLGEVVVRAAIRIDENTAAVSVNGLHTVVLGHSVLSPALAGLPGSLDGIPLRVRKLNVEINRGEFELNPTNCAAQAVTATLTSPQNVTYTASSHFDVGGCGGLAFKPAFSAKTQAKTSRKEGASLTVSIGQGKGEAHIKRVDVQLPRALPSRLTTLQHACTEAQFDSNPKGCPEQSYVGTATATTPLLASPLSGPAILVSRGAQFPDVDFLLEAEGIKIDVVGHTEIKNKITYSKFETVPDQPIDSFTASFPRGPHSILAANGNLCTQKLAMPTTIEGQDGAIHTQTTTVAVSGCRSTRSKLATALAACRKKDKGHKHRRLACESKARKRLAKKAKKSSARGRPSPALVAIAGAATQGVRETALALTSVTAAPASSPAPTPAQQGTCPNEARIAESDINPTTHEPYSAGLPECRAYEMVSPTRQARARRHRTDRGLARAATLSATPPKAISPNPPTSTSKAPACETPSSRGASPRRAASRSGSRKRPSRRRATSSSPTSVPR